MTAYAVAITEDNIYGIIRSEAGSDFNLAVALDWLTEHGEGWFLRDPSTVLDCSFFATEIFLEMYKFTSNDQQSLLRAVIQR